MPATRRVNGASTDSSSTPASSSTMSTPPVTHSPFRPTGAELILLSMYPLTLFFGSLFSHLSPSLRPPFNNSTYSVDAQSFQPSSAAPSYFAQKRNIFNVYFVKYGWFWCSFALLVFTALSSRGRAARSGKKQTSEERNQTDDRLRRRYQAFFRWAIATTFWVFVTQWFFGPPLIDRGFALSGGACELAAKNVENPENIDTKEEVAAVLTHAACNMARGTWRGGYDISGHVFILVLGSGMLWMEMLPFVARQFQGVGGGRVVRQQDGRISRVGSPETTRDAAAASISTPAALRSISDAVKNELKTTGATSKSASKTIRTYATTMTLAIAVLSQWMLLMTAAFFHTWFEKLTGFLLAFSALWVMYFAPRGVVPLRQVVGMPGL